VGVWSGEVLFRKGEKDEVSSEVANGGRRKVRVMKLCSLKLDEEPGKKRENGRIAR